MQAESTQPSAFERTAFALDKALSEPPTIEKGMEAEYRMGMIAKLERLIEMGMGRVSAKSTIKHERFKWATIVVNACKVLDGVLTNVEADRLTEMMGRIEGVMKEFDEYQKSLTPFARP